MLSRVRPPGKTALASPHHSNECDYRLLHREFKSVWSFLQATGSTPLVLIGDSASQAVTDGNVIRATATSANLNSWRLEDGIRTNRRQKENQTIFL